MSDDSSSSPTSKRSKIIKAAESVSAEDPLVYDYINRYAIHMVQEVARYAARIEKEYGEAFSRILLNQFISTLIASLVFKKLNDRPKGKTAGADILKHNIKMFTEAKLDLQEAVSTGVQAAMQKYSGQPIEYYCVVKAVTESPNKKPC